ncbi:ABC transporter ATP-binding protein [Aestuariivirga sp.]|jgi:glycerol transport system ATP-binding protein|uniref:ABC transporter ATP-binding protein n=1 Tax=Aestuariivirga sp. TaxID=2650926 RepID=UPI0037831A1F
MALELIDITKRAGAEVHIHPTSLVLHEGSFNVLLGTTLSGKTTLMQIMAGIQRPTSGSILFRGKDVTGVAVQQRNVSMVYQQFINYPNFSVYDNIASPLRVGRMSSSEVEKRVMAAADLLRLKPMLKRRPSELSGGQQQRTAIARAIVKDSDLILLDEPLANLDYKLREELRDELPKLFAGRNAIVVYATTEPSEALLFGGNTATLHEGRITQFGPTASTYRAPKDLLTAQVFSDPPMNTAPVEKRGDRIMIFGDRSWPVGTAASKLPDGHYMLGLRPHHVTPNSMSAVSGKVEGRVLVTELSGSESVIHLDVGGTTWVSLSHGIHPLEVGSQARLHADVDRALFFTPSGERVS